MRCFKRKSNRLTQILGTKFLTEKFGSCFLKNKICQMLYLHCILGLSIDETAQRLNVSLTAANKRLMLARRAVRAFVDERSGDHA